MTLSCPFRSEEKKGRTEKKKKKEKKKKGPEKNQNRSI
jgi:hypothetical protein